MVNAMSMLIVVMILLHLPLSVLARLVIPIQVVHLLRMVVAQVNRFQLVNSSLMLLITNEM